MEGVFCRWEEIGGKCPVGGVVDDLWAIDSMGARAREMRERCERDAREMRAWVSPVAVERWM